MENEVINTLQDGEPVTSTYADTFFDDKYCDNKQSIPDSDKDDATPKTLLEEDGESLWVSPSDLLIGIIDLNPPFTSKITRGKAHEGLLAIGNNILKIEREKFIIYLTDLINANDAAWNHILVHEKAAVTRKVKEIYTKIFKDKSKTMTQEITKFYEDTLRDMEQNIKVQLQDVLMSSHASIVSKLNTDIKEKLQQEKAILEKVLNRRYQLEVAKLKRYYRLLLINEKLRYKQLINKTIIERNDVIQAFIRQNEAENVTRTMYILSAERKKCRIKQFILENYQSQEIREKYEQLKRRQDIVDTFKGRETHITQINSEWESKIKKILQLFLKFISFSLQLLPEQTSFLLNFEKMVVLQLNEMQKMPHKQSSIIVNTENLDNTFKFEKIEEEKVECTKEPFVVTGGHISGTPSTQYGSRETIPDDVDLPVVRLERQFVYAKCHHYEEIKTRLEEERCKCMDLKTLKSPPEWKPSVSVQETQIEQAIKVPSVAESFERLVIDDIHRLDGCPVRNCQDWISKSTFPYLNAYLDFDDEKFNRVITILDKREDKTKTPQFIDPKNIIFRELPFGPTKEPFHNVETQCSSEEDLVPDITCPCFDSYEPLQQSSTVKILETPSKVIMDNITKRKTSLQRLLQQNPKLMKAFTDESFDFIF